MDHPEEPPKLPQKTVDVSKRVSYLMEPEKLQRVPKPMPRIKRKNSTEVSSPRSSIIVSPLQTDSSSSSNFTNISQNSTDTIHDSSFPQQPSPTPRPRPKPRKTMRSKGSVTSLDHDGLDKDFNSILSDQATDQISHQVQDLFHSHDSTILDQLGNTQGESEHKTDKVNPMVSVDDGVFSENPVTSSHNGLSSLTFRASFEEADDCDDEYMFPDGVFDKTESGNDVGCSQSADYENSGNDFKIDENNFEGTFPQAVEPTTPKPFDVKPFKRTIPFVEETSFIEVLPETQHHSTLRSSDLFDFDPLLSRSTSDSQNGVNNTGIALSLDFPLPAPERSLPEDPSPISPGVYVSLQDMEQLSQCSVPSEVPANTSLKYSPSFHWDPPEGPPPPLPRFPASSVRDSAPPPVPPRPRPSNLSPMMSQRSSPSGSPGTSSEASVRSSPLTTGNQTGAVTSTYLDDLPTPLFSPMEQDPFTDTNFGDVCYSFNKTHTLPESPSTVAAAGGSSTYAHAAAAAADLNTPSPAGPAPATMQDQDFEVDFDAAFSGQNRASSDESSEECTDPGRISRFVIPPPGSLALGKASLDRQGDYDLAQEFQSSTDESESGDDNLDSEPPAWSTPAIPHDDLTLVSSSTLSQKKTTRYGYLYKQGGYNANKGWKKRWVVFNGTSLSYFDSNTSQISKRIVPVSCMKDIATDVKPAEKHSFKFKVVTTLKDRVFIFSAETLEDCLTWANSLMAAITEHKKSCLENDVKPLVDKPDKEGMIKFNAMRKYYVVIKGHMMSYYQSLEDFEMGSPIHQMDMKLASVKVKDRRRFKLQLYLHYGHFDLTLENESEMQAWRMAIEDSIAEGLADDTVLEKVYQNLSNQQCADCGDKSPHWASINIGIVLCKNCAGIHRMFDYRISKVRSLRMDTRVWTPSLIELMVTIGNANANAFWENKVSEEARLQPQDDMEERKEFISQKYLRKKYCNLHALTNEKRLLGEELLRVSSTDNVLEAMQVLFSGADIMFRKDEGRTAYEIAKDLGQRLVMELLYQNGGDPQSKQDNADDENRLREDVRLQGYLYKAGPGGKTFDKRWCILEHGTLTYYQNEKSLTSRGSIERRHMLLLQKVNIGRPGHNFEISTDIKDQRTFTFSAENEEDGGEWMRTISKLMSPVSIMEHVGMLDIKFAGYAHFKRSLQSEWLQTFLVFIWRGLYFMNEDLKLDYLDLRKATSIKLQNPEDGCPEAIEKGPCFVISFAGMSVYAQAFLIKDTEKMFVALESAAKCSGKTLHDQVLTSENIPVIIEKCITHISIEGLHEKGIYRHAAQMSKVDALLTEFRRDATSVTFSNCTVHEVANAMKKFLRELDDSVFERINYPLWINSAGLRDDNNRLMWYKYYLNKMSLVNYSTLRRIILHLKQVSKYESSNQMTIQNLATCFAPSLMRTLSDESNFMSDVPSREINIIIDLLNYHEYFFQFNDTKEKKKEEEIQKAEKEIKERLRSDQESKVPSSETSMESILIPVHMLNPDGQAININVTNDLKVHSAMEYFRKSHAAADIDTSSFGMCELLFKGDLERPLLPDELLNTTVKRWMEWEPWVSSDNSISLCAREMDILNRLDRHTKTSSTHILLSKLYYRDSKSKRFKRYPIGFRQCRLSLYNSIKASEEVISWPVENLVFYFGCSAAKKAPPSKHCLTFLVEGEKCSKTQGIFGHCLSFESEEELYRWSSAFFLAQNPKGLLGWSVRL